MKTLYTGEDLEKLNLPGRWELVRGELTELTPPGWEHGEVQVNVASLLRAHARACGGRVASESGIYTESNPDTVRGPDISYIRPGRLGKAPPGFSRVVPDLVVEVVSPHDSSAELESKVEEYLTAGTLRVWLVYPGTRTVYVHGPRKEIRKLTQEDVLTDPEILPGLACPVAEFFEGLQ